MQDQDWIHTFSDTFRESSDDLGFLVERPDVLNQVHNALINPTGPPVVLVGPPGVGKTTLVKLYLHKHSEEFHGVTLISAREFAPDIAEQPETVLLLFQRRIAEAFGADHIGNQGTQHLFLRGNQGTQHLFLRGNQGTQHLFLRMSNLEQKTPPHCYSGRSRVGSSYRTLCYSIITVARIARGVLPGFRITSRSGAFDLISGPWSCASSWIPGFLIARL